MVRETALQGTSGKRWLVRKQLKRNPKLQHVKEMMNLKHQYHDWAPTTAHLAGWAAKKKTSTKMTGCNAKSSRRLIFPTYLARTQPARRVPASQILIRNDGRHVQHFNPWQQIMWQTRRALTSRSEAVQPATRHDGLQTPNPTL